MRKYWRCRWWFEESSKLSLVNFSRAPWSQPQTTCLQTAKTTSLLLRQHKHAYVRAHKRTKNAPLMLIVEIFAIKQNKINWTIQYSTVKEALLLTVKNSWFGHAATSLWLGQFFARVCMCVRERARARVCVWEREREGERERERDILLQETILRYRLKTFQLCKTSSHLIWEQSSIQDSRCLPY